MSWSYRRKTGGWPGDGFTAERDRLVKVLSVDRGVLMSSNCDQIEEGFCMFFQWEHEQFKRAQSDVKCMKSVLGVDGDEKIVMKERAPELPLISIQCRCSIYQYPKNRPINQKLKY